MNKNQQDQKEKQVRTPFRQRLPTLLKRAGLDGFILALLLVIVLAKLWPEPGVQEGPFSLSETANYGVTLIFFLYGLRLNPEKLRAGLSNWRLHLLVQFSTFILFPLLILAAKVIFENPDNSLLWLGIFFLAALPSTVSSSVVMVSIASGNLPAAIFNASISSLLGILITPMWMGLFQEAGAGSFDFGNVITKLAFQVLLPVILGLLLHRKLGAWAEKHKKQLRYFDQTIILMIVYTSFCESFDQDMFAPYSLLDMLVLSAGMVLLFGIVYGLIYQLSSWLRFNREDKITAVFCGSKKSLVHGTVMAKVLFSGNSTMGLMLLPIMIYHALQLILASIIAQAMAQRKEKVITRG